MALQYLITILYFSSFFAVPPTIISPNIPATTPTPIRFEISSKVKPNGLTMYSIYTVNKITGPNNKEKDSDNIKKSLFRRRSLAA